MNTTTPADTVQAFQRQFLRFTITRPRTDNRTQTVLVAIRDISNVENFPITSYDDDPTIKTRIWMRNGCVYLLTLSVEEIIEAIDEARSTVDPKCD